MARRNGGFVGQDGLDAPDPPTGITPTAGELSVSVAFTAPSDAGTSAITGFVVQLSTDDTAYSAGSNTGTSSPIVVSSLTAGTAATAKVWAINAYGTSAPSSASASFTPLALARALFSGGYLNSASVDVIDYVTISTTGNATDFGDLTAARLRGGGSGASSTTRGVFGGGTGNDSSNVIDYVTIASTGDATDFGDLTSARYDNSGLSNSTRGIWAGGTSSNVIDYITIGSTGNATDFGDRSVTGGPLGAFASSTRGVSGGAPSGSNVIDYITIASTGNSTDFGNLTAGGNYGSGCSSGTRGVFFGGFRTSSVVTMDYVTIASTGNASDFGDLQSAPSQNSWGTSSSTRGLCAATFGTGTDIQYITIASTGDALDFGNLTDDRHQLPHQAVSSGHGGLQ